jgi:hypothetical protein
MGCDEREDGGLHSRGGSGSRMGLVALLATCLILAPASARGAAEERALRAQIAHAEGAELHALLQRWMELRRKPAAKSEPKVITIETGAGDEFNEFAQFSEPSAAGGGIGGAGNASVFGRFVTKIAVDTNRDNRFEDYFDWRTELRPGVDLRWSDATTLRLSAKALHQMRTGYKTRWDWETKLYEGYVDHSTGPYDIRVGRQIVSWGRADAINPTDNLNPQDLREIVTIYHDDRKIPITMVRVRRAWERSDLDVVYIPFFEPNEFDLIGGDFAALQPGFLPKEWERVFYKLTEELRSSRVTYSGESIFRIDEPEEKGYNGELGARWTSKAGRFDYSLSAFYTYDDMPSFKLDLDVLRRFNLRDEDTRRFLENAEVSDLLRLRHIFQQKFRRQMILGADFETLVGRSSVRGEAALTFNHVYYRKDLTRADRPVLNYVVGIDRTMAYKIYGNLQFLQQVLLRYDSDIITERVRSGVTAALRRDAFDDQLHLKLSTLYFLDDGDYFLNLEAAYDLADALNVAAGVNFFQGDRDASLLETATISKFTNNDQVYSRLLYHF